MFAKRKRFAPNCGFCSEVLHKLPAIKKDLTRNRSTLRKWKKLCKKIYSYNTLLRLFLIKSFVDHHIPENKFHYISACRNFLKINCSALICPIFCNFLLKNS